MNCAAVRHGRPVGSRRRGTRSPSAAGVRSPTQGTSQQSALPHRHRPAVERESELRRWISAHAPQPEISETLSGADARRWCVPARSLRDARWAAAASCTGCTTPCGTLVLARRHDAVEALVAGNCACVIRRWARVSAGWSGRRAQVARVALSTARPASATTLRHPACAASPSPSAGTHALDRLSAPARPPTSTPIRGDAQGGLPCAKAA